MAAEHHEVEDKYDLDESTVLPDFATLPGVVSVTTAEHELVATYFDTTDLALAAAGIVLRRRTGGEDAGWHLKLPMSDGRLEIAVPLSRAVHHPPSALRKVVVGVTRDRPLAPVVVIRTERRLHRLHGKAGRVLAEVADDRVSAEPAATDAPGLAPITWREVEVELVSGKLALLVRTFDLMKTVGARRSESPSKLSRALGDRPAQVVPPALPRPRRKGPASDVIQLRLRQQVTTMRQLDPWVRHGAPEAVHDMRVAARRLRNALASYRSFLDTERSEPLRDELSWLAALLGGPRDCEVLRDLLRELTDDEPPDLVTRAVRSRIDGDLGRRYDATRADLVAGMTTDRYFDLVDRLEAFAGDPPWTEAARKKAGRVLSKGLDGDWKRLRSRVLKAVPGAGSAAAADAGDLHDVRKAAKRVRYAAESLAPISGKRARRMVEAHERIQTVLGDHHDATEALHALIELATAATSAGENAFAYGRLHAHLERRRSGLAAEFDQAWEDSLTARARYRAG
jgi:CHAD domain-containing protein